MHSATLGAVHRTQGKIYNFAAWYGGAEDQNLGLAASLKGNPDGFLLIFSFLPQVGLFRR